MLMLLNTSLMTPAEFNKSPMSLPSSFSLDNFLEAWDKASFPRYLLNTVIYTVVSTVIFVVTGTFLSVAIARRFVRGGGLMFTLFLIALFLPPALIPQFQLILRLGLYNNPIGYIMLFVVNPIGIVILVNYIRTIPMELDEAAAIEGCGYLRFVFQIIMPLTKPAIATVAVLHAIGVWNELVLPTIYLTSRGLLPHHAGPDRLQRGLRQQLAAAGGRRPDDRPARWSSSSSSCSATSSAASPRERSRASLMPIHAAPGRSQQCWEPEEQASSPAGGASRSGTWPRAPACPPPRSRASSTATPRGPRGEGRRHHRHQGARLRPQPRGPQPHDPAHRLGRGGRPGVRRPPLR